MLLRDWSLITGEGGGLLKRGGACEVLCLYVSTLKRGGGGCEHFYSVGGGGAQFIFQNP